MEYEDRIARRSIGIAFADGGLLALSATGRRAGAHHDEEDVVTVLCDPDGAPVEVAETMLSTEYGPDGTQRRVTIELWPAEGRAPMRGAGSLISAAAVERPGRQARIAFFRFSLDGREGLGHYEIVSEDA